MKVLSLLLSRKKKQNKKKPDYPLIRTHASQLRNRCSQRAAMHIRRPKNLRSHFFILQLSDLLTDTALQPTLKLPPTPHISATATQLLQALAASYLRSCALRTVSFTHTARHFQRAVRNLHLRHHFPPPSYPTSSITYPPSTFRHVAFHTNRLMPRKTT